MIDGDSDIGYDEKVAPKTPEMDKEERLVHFIGKMIFATVVVFIVTVGGCTAHSNYFDGERNLTEAEIVQAQAVKVKAQAEVNKAKVESIKQLIDDGINPIGARCAVEGWKNDSDRKLCERIGLVLGGKMGDTQ